VDSLLWLTTIGVLIAVGAIAVAGTRVTLRRRADKAQLTEATVSVGSRLAGHAPAALVDSAPVGSIHDEMDVAILAVLRATPNVYTKTALAKHVGFSYATVLKRVTALQHDGHIVPNVRGAKLALAPTSDESLTGDIHNSV
jgi:hypothetical protein